MKLNKKLIIGVIAIAAIFVSNLQYAIDNYGIDNWGLGLEAVASGSGGTGTGPTGTGTDTPSGRDTHISTCSYVERWDNHLKQWVIVHKYEGFCAFGTKQSCRDFNCTDDPDILNSTENYMDYEPDLVVDEWDFSYMNPPDHSTMPPIVIPPSLNN